MAFLPFSITSQNYLILKGGICIYSVKGCKESDMFIVYSQDLCNWYFVHISNISSLQISTDHLPAINNGRDRQL